MTHRKHVHEWEIDPVAEAIREHLKRMVPLYSIDSFRGESELGSCSPNCEPALVNLINMEDY